MKLSISQKLLLLLLVACHLGANVRSQVSDEPNCGYLNERNYANLTHIADLREFPWIARVGYETDRGIVYKCLAVLITRQFLLAPAECFVGEEHNKAQVRWVLLGDWNPRNPYIEHDCDAQQNCNSVPQLVEIDEIFIHPNYNNQTFANNLSLLKLVRRVNFSSHISSICLQGSSSISPYDRVLQYAGFAVSSSFGHKLKGSTQIQQINRCRETLYGYNYTRAASSSPLYPLCGTSAQNTTLLRGSPLMDVKIVDGKPQSYILVGLLQIMTNQRNSQVFITVVPYIKWIEQSIQRMMSSDILVLPTIIPARLVRYEKYTVSVDQIK